MKTSNNYISVDTAKTLINNGGKFNQGFYEYQKNKGEYKIFRIIHHSGIYFLNKKNAGLIKDWLKTQNK
jgi:hypothetical protein